MSRLTEDGGPQPTDPLDPEVDVAEEPDADLGPESEPDLDEPEEEASDDDNPVGD